METSEKKVEQLANEWRENLTKDNAVTVYDVASQSPISIVIIPVISSILVVVIIIAGVALSAHYRNRLAVEVADFDFGQADEEDLQYKSFWERLRESFGIRKGIVFNRDY